MVRQTLLYAFSRLLTPSKQYFILVFEPIMYIVVYDATAVIKFTRSIEKMRRLTTIERDVDIVDCGIR